MARRKQKRTWQGAKQLEALLVPIDQLTDDPKNARRHDARNLAAIRESLAQFGQLRPVVVRPIPGDRVRVQLVAGHGTTAAARALGWSHVAALVTDLDDLKARAFGIADNRTAELASWDAGQLVDALDDPDLGGLLDAMGFSTDEIEALAKMGDQVEAEAAAAEATPAARAPAPAAIADPAAAPAPAPLPEDDGEDLEPDELPEPPKEPVTQRGDVWQLGDHRLFCGDSLQEEGRKFLGVVDCVLTDPPYAIYGSSSGIASDIADDKMVRPFFRSLGVLFATILREFGHFYTFTDWRSWASLWDGFRERVSVRNCVVWAKGGGLGSNYSMCHELIAFGSKLPKQKAMVRGRKAGMRLVLKPNLIECPRVRGEEREHNAAKPVPLLLQLLENSTDAGQVVAEPFGGSGSTLIACEKAGRVCRAVEIEPAWCDVIVARWERFTGRKATKADK